MSDMRINIEILDNESVVKQLEAVKQYIIDNKKFNTHSDIMLTDFDSGSKVFHNHGSNHVKCTKTKKGNYSFKVWLG